MCVCVCVCVCVLCACVRACVTQAPDLFRMVDINDDGSIRSGMQREDGEGEGGERESESFTIIGEEGRA